MWRFWNQVNTHYLMDAMRGANGKGIDTEKALASPADLYIGVADFATGKPHLLKPETGEELLTAIQASILMPNVTSDIVTFRDIRYADGGFTSPHVLSVALDEIEATHILILANQEKEVTTIPFLERFFNHTLFRMRMPGPLRFAAHERRKERIKAIEKMKKRRDISYALVWGDRSVRSMERDPMIVKDAIVRSKAWAHKLLG